MRTAMLGLAIMSLLSSAVDNAFGEVRYRVTDLGTLGGTFSLPVDINASGQVVGYSDINHIVNGGYHGFLYADGTMIDLGATLGGSFSDAYGINDNGQIAGSAAASDGKSRAVVWQDGVMTNLGLLSGTTISRANAINNSGKVVGNSWAVYDKCHAFLYTDGAMVDISHDNVFSWANDINDLGQIVGGAGGAQSSSRAFVLSGNTMTYLGQGCSQAINAVGQVVGQVDSHAFLYSDGTMFDLGTLGGSYSVAADINASGQIVGYSGTNSGVRAFLYSDGTMTDLNTLIDQAPGGILTYVYAINDSGQVVGRYENASTGETHAVLLTPVPEPSALVLLGMGAISLIAYAWRRRA